MHPEIVYTHNLADKHDTHVAVALRTIAPSAACRPASPEKVYSLEVWRGLDWLCDEDKVCFDTSNIPALPPPCLAYTTARLRAENGMTAPRSAAALQTQPFLPVMKPTTAKACPTDLISQNW